MTGITWLHLSDWHQKGKNFDRKVVLDRLLEDLSAPEKIDPSLAKIDFVVFSGDIAWSGQADQYKAVKKDLLVPILDKIYLNADRLFIVPGNHDLDRAIVVDEMLPAALQSPFTSDEQVQTWLTDNKRRVKVLEPFKKYRQFVKNFTGQPSSEYASVCQWEIDNTRVALLGINSAWMCARHKDSKGEVDDFGWIIVGEPQIHDALEKITNADIKIAVTHHPFDWLAPFDRNRVENRLMRDCNFILHGHGHKPQATVINGTSGNCVIIPAGASFERRVAVAPPFTNSYNLVHLNNVTGQGVIYFRKWSDPRGAWIEDNDTCPGGKFEFAIPRSSKVSPTCSQPLNESDALSYPVDKPSQQPIDKWLDYFHFQRSPFERLEAVSAEYAEKDFLSRCFVYPDCFWNVLGQFDAPTSALVFGARGTGKTALRVMIDYNCKHGGVQDRKTGQRAYILSVPHIHWREIASKNAQIGSSSNLLEQHVIEIMERAMPQFVELCILGKSIQNAILNISELVLPDLNWYVNQYRRHLTDLQIGILGKLGIKLPFNSSSYPWLKRQKALSPLVHLEHWCQLMFNIGIKAVYVLVDGLDELDTTAADIDEAYRFFAPLITNRDLIDKIPYFALKCFLPAPMEALIQVQPDLVHSYHIQWSEDLLIELLRTRILYFRQENSQGQISSFAELCVPELYGNIEQDLASTANGNPRRLLKLCDLMVRAHCRSQGTLAGNSFSLTPEDLTAARIEFERDYLREDVNSPENNSKAGRMDQPQSDEMNDLTGINFMPFTTQTDAILIVTAAKIEAQAVLKTFSPGPVKRKMIADKIYYDLGQHGGAPVFMVQSEMGAATPGGAVLTISQAIQDLRPQAIIMCGGAYGLRKDKQKLGDILVSKQLHYYDPQDVDREIGTQLGDRVTASARLLGRFRDAELEWTGAPLHFGLILSGEKLVNNATFRNKLLAIEPKAIGGEMEGAGLYAAANKNDVDWILVKAICDWADGEKMDDDARPLAIRNAAQFVLYVLEMGEWGKNQPDLSTPEPLQVISETKSNEIILDNQQLRSLEDALLSAFPTKSALDRMLSYQQGKNLEVIVGGGSLQTIVFELIRKARSEGWLLALIRGAQVENPGNPDLADFCRKMGLT